jgi:hypothetical protein
LLILTKRYAKTKKRIANTGGDIDSKCQANIIDKIPNKNNVTGINDTISNTHLGSIWNNGFID